MPTEAARPRRTRGTGTTAGHYTTGDADMPAGDAAITLGLLDAVHANASISQRSLASELGIALGLTNAYIRRCVRLGLLKVSQAPANRYAYYLTPNGFTEKSRLTASYLSRSFEFYRSARRQCDELFAGAAARGWQRIGLFGQGDLTEIAVLCAMAHPVTVAGLVAPKSDESRFLHLPVVKSVAGLGDVAGVLFTEFQRPQAAYDALRQELAADRILVPALLKVRTGTVPSPRMMVE